MAHAHTTARLRDARHVSMRSIGVHGLGSLGKLPVPRAQRLLLCVEPLLQLGHLALEVLRLRPADSGQVARCPLEGDCSAPAG